MNVYITTGTYDFLKTIKKKHSSQNMILMEGAQGAALVHETSGKTLFASPRRYEVVDGSGDLAGRGYVVMNNIPVTDEGRPIFEHRFKTRTGAIENEPGFVCLRVLRPLGSNTYVVFTQWEDVQSFEKWKASDSFNKAHKKKESEAGIGQRPDVFSGASYVTTYTIPKDDQ